MENHFALQHQLQEFLSEDQLGAACIAKNDNCVPRTLREQPKKNENNLKEYWTQWTLRMRVLAFQLDFSLFPSLIFPETLALPFIKLPLQFFNKEAYQEQFKKRAETLFVSDVAMGISKKIRSKVEYLPPDTKDSNKERIKEIEDWSFHLNRAWPTRCTVSAVLCWLQKRLSLSIKI